MRRIIISIAATLAALCAGPAAAQAHHLDQDTSKIVCVLVANSPTVQVTAHYVDFTRWDQPVSRVTRLDGVIAPQGTGDIPIWSGPDYFDRISIVVAPGQHDVSYDATWNQGDNSAGMRRRVICPTPMPPPPLPPPPPPPVFCPAGTTPMPSPAGTVICSTPTPKPKPCPCRPHPRPKPKHPHRVSCQISYFNHDPLPGAHVSRAGCRITVVHPHITHGRQVFVVSCAAGMRAGGVRWWIDGKRVHNHHLTHTTSGGKRLVSFLFDQRVWGHQLWGRHHVRASVRVARA